MAEDLSIKICGMRDPENIREVSALQPDYMGFIFYPGSRRFYGEPDVGRLRGLDPGIKRCGVFVDEDPSKVLEICKFMGLQAVQLHGNESPGYCTRMQEAGLEVLKVFNINAKEDFRQVQDYMDCCDYFLFDTGSTPGKYSPDQAPVGGTGSKFNWELLHHYKLDKPFFLSGGIRPGDEEKILNIRHKKLTGIDLNSGFETDPGKKQTDQLKHFMERLK